MDLQLLELQHFLDIVSGIDKRYQDVWKEREDVGISYNVFNVLGLSTSEVGLHSAILASLLMPDGHGAGRHFLEAFLKIPSLHLHDRFLNPEKTVVEKEKYIGPVTDTDGGRIDLYLTDGNNYLIIENKIYAADQWNQLLRYHNYKKSARLVYLTLDGSEPSDDSLGGVLSQKDITCISYKDDIIPWLQECVRISATLPYIRETLNQYIHTLKQLTNTDMATNNEIINLLSEEKNIDSIFMVRNNLDAAINKIMKDFLSALREKTVAKTGFSLDCFSDNMTDKYSGVQFSREGWKNVCVAIEFDNSGLNKMAIGFLKTNPNIKDIRQLEGVKKVAENLRFDKNNNNWFWCYPSEHSYWYNSATIKQLFNGQMEEWIINTLNVIAEVTEKIGGTDF